MLISTNCSWISQKLDDCLRACCAGSCALHTPGERSAITKTSSGTRASTKSCYRHQDNMPRATAVRDSGLCLIGLSSERHEEPVHLSEDISLVSAIETAANVYIHVACLWLLPGIMAPVPGQKRLMIIKMVLENFKVNYSLSPGIPLWW
jgi:hypothetical protein